MFNLLFISLNIILFIILSLLIISLNIKPCDTWNCINSFALWFSAVGLLAVSTITLLLTMKDKRIQIISSFNRGSINNDTCTTPIFILSCENIGVRKVKIIAQYIIINNTKIWFDDVDDKFKSYKVDKLPLTLDITSSYTTYIDNDFFINLHLLNNKETLFHTCRYITLYRIYTFYIELSIIGNETIKVKPHSSVKKMLWEQYKKEEFPR